MDELTSPSLKALTEWVKLQHGNQLIRDTNKPYFSHLIAVSNMVGDTIPMGYEIGLCHDLFEDTIATPTTLLASLLSFNYPDTDAIYITATVTELTDKFTKQAYPDLSKRVRKEMETERWLGMSAAAQTVKYCDLIYNVGWVMEYQTKKVKSYLKKKKALLKEMNKGNEALHHLAIETVANALKTYKSRSH